MKLSTRRSLRVAAQGTIAGAAFLPVLVDTLNLPAGPVAKIAGTIVIGAAFVTKTWNAIEARWPAASRWLLGGATITTDTRTGETVTTPEAVAAIDAG